MRRALITGAGGTLGLALSRRLEASPSWVVVKTARSSTKAGFVPLDVAHAESVMAAVAEASPDIVFHLAASFSEDFDKAFACNVTGARNILTAIESAGGKARVLLMGSAAEYGLVHPEDNPISERQSLRPMSVYGLTKAWQSQLGLMWASRGADVVVARLFNLLADGMAERLFVGRVQRQIRELLAGARDAIEVGNLDCVRDYVPLEDAIDQILAVATKGTAGSAYHIASGQPVQMRDVLSRMLQEHDLGMEVVMEGAASSTHSGYDVPIAYADTTATRRLIQQPRTSLR